MIKRGWQAEAQKKGLTAGFPKGWTDHLETPAWLFDQLHRVFRFDMDVAASASTSRVKLYFSDSLTEDWAEFGSRAYLNPPYSNPRPFLVKAKEQQRRGVLTVALLKLDPSVEWWDETDAAQLHVLRRRVRFDYQGKPAPYAASFPSVLAIYYAFMSAKGDLLFR